MITKALLALSTVGIIETFQFFLDKETGNGHKVNSNLCQLYCASRQWCLFFGLCFSQKQVQVGEIRAMMIIRKTEGDLAEVDFFHMLT